MPLTCYMTVWCFALELNTTALGGMVKCFRNRFKIETKNAKRSERRSKKLSLFLSSEEEPLGLNQLGILLKSIQRRKLGFAKGVLSLYQGFKEAMRKFWNIYRRTWRLKFTWIQAIPQDQILDTISFSTVEDTNSTRNTWKVTYNNA